MAQMTTTVIWAIITWLSFALCNISLVLYESSHQQSLAQIKDNYVSHFWLLLKKQNLDTQGYILQSLWALTEKAWSPWAASLGTANMDRMADLRLRLGLYGVKSCEM